MSGAATGLGTWLADWLPLTLADGVGAACHRGVDTSVSRPSSRATREAMVEGQRRRRSRPRVPRMSRMLWGTAVVNVIACPLMGLLVGRTADSPHSGTWAAATLTVLGTGFLGGYSTFSMACVEGARLLLTGRWGSALVHAVLITTATLGAVGLKLAAGAALRQSTTQPGSRSTSTKTL